MKKSRLWSKEYICICISSFFLFMTMYSLMTVLPLLVINEFSGSDQQAGLTMTMFLLGSVICRPFSGKWIDELGRKKMLLISLFLFSAISIMYIEVNSISSLLILRFIHGISFALANTTLYTVVADLICEKRRGEGLGYFSTFMNLAMVIGPFLGLTMVAGGNFNSFFMATAIFAVSSFLFGNIIRIPKTLVKREVMKNEYKGLKRYFETNVMTIALAGSFVAFAYAGVSTFSSIYAKQIGVSEVAAYFFVSYAIMLILSRPFVGKLFDRSGANTVIYPAFFIFILGLVSLALAKGPFMFLISGAIIGVGNGTLFSSLQTIAVSICPENRRGVATSTYFMIYDTGMGVGSFILGIIATHTNYHLMYFVSALIVLISTLCYYTLFDRKINSIDNYTQLVE